jgi:predicted esterase
LKPPSEIKIMLVKIKFILCIALFLYLKITYAVPEFSKGPGLLFLVGSSVGFSDSNKWVNFEKSREENSKLMIYAHGGSGLTEADKLRVSLFKKLGFDTVSFDAFAMNELDGTWVNRNLTDRAKQDLIMNVMTGAIEVMLSKSNYTDVVLYGQSNGAKVVINTIKSPEIYPRIKLVLSEAPPPSGYSLPLNMHIPTFLFFGAKDNWAGKNENDLIWTRKYQHQKLSIIEWVDQQANKGQPVKDIFYPNSGHSFHSGMLTPVSRNMAGIGTITGYLGASVEDKMLYEDDVKRIVGQFIK